jgi:hypothetical protein
MLLKGQLSALLTVSFWLFVQVTATSDVLDLTSGTFDETMKDNPLVLAEFFAPWVTSYSLSWC